MKVSVEKLKELGVEISEEEKKNKDLLKRKLRRVIESKRYELAKELGADAKTARKARAWSSKERWIQEFGKQIRDKRVPQYPTEKRPKVSYETKLKRKRQRYQELRRLGFDAKTASKGRSERAFDRLMQKVRGVKKGPRRSKSSRQKREKQWALWAKSETGFPRWVLDYVAKINARRDLPSDAGYGFGILWHWYTRGGTLKSWIKKLKPDQHDYDMYTFANTRAL